MLWVWKFQTKYSFILYLLFLYFSLNFVEKLLEIFFRDFFQAKILRIFSSFVNCAFISITMHLKISDFEKFWKNSKIIWKFSKLFFSNSPEKIMRNDFLGFFRYPLVYILASTCDALFTICIIIDQLEVS